MHESVGKWNGTCLVPDLRVYKTENYSVLLYKRLHQSSPQTVPPPTYPKHPASAVSSPHAPIFATFHLEYPNPLSPPHHDAHHAPPSLYHPPPHCPLTTHLRPCCPHILQQETRHPLPMPTTNAGPPRVVLALVTSARSSACSRLSPKRKSADGRAVVARSAPTW